MEGKNSMRCLHFKGILYVSPQQVAWSFQAGTFSWLPCALQTPVGELLQTVKCTQPYKGKSRQWTQIQALYRQRITQVGQRTSHCQTTEGVLSLYLADLFIRGDIQLLRRGQDVRVIHSTFSLGRSRLAAPGPCLCWAYLGSFIVCPLSLVRMLK